MAHARRAEWLDRHVLLKRIAASVPEWVRDALVDTAWRERKTLSAYLRDFLIEC